MKQIWKLWDSINTYIANTMLRVLYQEQQGPQREKAGYALRVILSETEKLILLAIIFLLQKRLIPFLLSVGVLGSIRIYMGGSHRKTMLGCFFQSYVTLQGIVWLGEYVKMSETVQILCSAVFVFMIWKITPISSAQRPKYSETQYMHFRMMAITMLYLWMLVQRILPSAYQNYVVWAQCAQFAENLICIFLSTVREKLPVGG